MLPSLCPMWRFSRHESSGKSALIADPIQARARKLTNVARVLEKKASTLE